MLNFTSAELEVLLAGIEKHWAVINGQQQLGPVNQENVWEIIAREMEGVGPERRTPGALKRKKQKLFHATRMKVPGECLECEKKVLDYTLQLN